MAVRYSKSIDLLTGTDPAEASVGVTADTTGPTIDASLFQLKSVQFRASGITSGNGVFSVEVSNDGLNWVTYNRLTTNATNTNAQTDIGVASVTLSSNTSAIYFFRAGDYFRYVRGVVDVTTDGTYFAAFEGV